MRQENNKTKRNQLTAAAGYHHSSFDEMVYWASDRKIKMVPKRNDFNRIEYVREDGKPCMAFGYEQELSCGWGQSFGKDVAGFNVASKIIYGHWAADMWRFENDCSISGPECISQCLSKEAWRNNYCNMKLSYEYMTEMRMLPKGGECGMHCNISNGNFGKTAEEIEENVRKFCYFINKHYDFCKVLLGRNGSTQYCGQMDTAKDYWKEVDLTGFGNNHYVCINLVHYTEGRVELRLVGAQESFPMFRNTTESIFALIPGIKACSWDNLDDIAKVFKKVNAHCYDRLTKCRTAGVLAQSTLDKIVNTDEVIYQ